MFVYTVHKGGKSLVRVSNNLHSEQMTSVLPVHYYSTSSGQIISGILQCQDFSDCLIVRF